MIVNDKNTYSIKGSSNTEEMGINISKKAFEILSSGIYDEKIPAIVRETVSNALDASKKANITTPVIVNFPTVDNTDFFVQDFGVGMDKDTVINVFANYFSSNKENDGEQIGGFGLGAKTPFIYTDVFKVETTSPVDNVRRTFLFSIEKDIPEYSHLDKLDVPNSNTKGTKVSFKINTYDDSVEFIKGFKQMIYSSYPIDLKFGDNSKDSIFLYVGNDLEITKKITKNLNDDGYCFFYKGINDIPNALEPIEAYAKAYINIRLGDVMYPYYLNKINEDEYNYYNKLLTSLFFNNIDEFFKRGETNFISDSYIFIDERLNGSITLTASRENINVTPENTKRISEILFKSIDDSLLKSVKNAIKIVKSIEINANNFLFCLFCKKTINEFSDEMKKDYKSLSPHFDELKLELNNRFEQFSAVLNEEISLATKNTDCYSKLAYKVSRSNEFLHGGDNPTINKFIDYIAKNSTLKANIETTNCMLVNSNQLGIIRIVKINKPIDNYKSSDIRRFINNVRVSMFDNLYASKGNTVKFIFIKDENVYHYDLDEEIEKNIDEMKLKLKKTTKNSSSNSSPKVAKNKDLPFINVTCIKLNDYDNVIEHYKNKVLSIILPETIRINIKDNIFEKTFKRSYYQTDIKSHTEYSYNFHKLLKGFDILLVPNDIYLKLIENNIIDDSFFNQLFNKQKINIDCLLNLISTININEFSDEAEKIKGVEQRELDLVLSKHFSNDVINSIYDKIILEIKEIATANDYYKHFMKTNLSCSNIYHNADNDNISNYIGYLKEFREKYKIPCNEIHYDSYVYDSCNAEAFLRNYYILFELSNGYPLDIIDIKKLKEIIEAKFYNLMDKNVGVVSVIIKCYNHFFDFDKKSYNDSFFSYAADLYRDQLFTKMNKNNMFFDDPIEQRAIDLANEL